MSFHDSMLDAIQLVLDLDFPDDVCPQALMDRAALMAHSDPEQLGGDGPE